MYRANLLNWDDPEAARITSRRLSENGDDDDENDQEEDDFLVVYHSSDEEDEANGQFDDAVEVDESHMRAFVLFLAVVVLYAAEIQAS